MFTHAGSLALGNVGAQWGTFTVATEGRCSKGNCVFDGTWVGDNGSRMDSAELDGKGLAPGDTVEAARPSVESPLMPAMVYSPWRLRLETLMCGFFGLVMAGVTRSMWRQRRQRDGADDEPHGADDYSPRHAPADYRPRHAIGAGRTAVTAGDAPRHAQAGDSPFSR